MHSPLKYFPGKPALNASVLLKQRNSYHKQANCLLFKSTVIFILSAKQQTSKPANQPAIRLSSARCRALSVTLNKGLPYPIYETDILKTIIPLRHGDSFILPF